MKAQRMHVVVPENRRAMIEFPSGIRPGPVELIALVPEDDEPESKAAAPQGRSRLALLAAELAQENRPFGDLTLEERGARLRRLRGAGRGMTSGSEEFARRKLKEIEIEDRHLGGSPLDVQGVDVGLSADEIVSLLRESRDLGSQWDEG